MNAQCRVALGMIVAMLVTGIFANSALAEVLTRGNYICVKYQHRPGYFKETYITERIADAAGIIAAYYTAVSTGGVGTALAKGFVGTNVRYVTKVVLQWVPASTTCLQWEHSSATEGNEYQY